MNWQGLVIQALNVTLMFSVGLELDPRALRSVLERRALIGAAIALNFGLIPLLAYGSTQALMMPGGVAAGLMLAALAPGGGTGTLLTRWAGGNLELSVVLLGVFTLLAVPLTPALMIATTGSSASGELTLLPVVQTLLLFQLAPLLIGLGLRRLNATAAAVVNRGARPLSNLLFGALVLGLLITRAHLLGRVGASVLMLMSALVAATLLAPALLRVEPRDGAALSLTTGVRNLSLAMLLSHQFFTDLTTITVLAYGVLMYLLGVPWALASRRRRERATALEGSG